MASVPEPSAGARRDALYRLLTALRGSLLLSSIAAGVALLLVAAVFESPLRLTQSDGVLAGILGVFGVSAVAVGVLGYGIVRVLRRA